MIDQPQQFDDTGEYVDKAKDHAQQNPDRARSVIDKIEDFVDEKTGGKYSAQVDRAPSYDTRWSDHAPLVVSYA